MTQSEGPLRLQPGDAMSCGLRGGKRQAQEPSWGDKCGTEDLPVAKPKLTMLVRWGLQSWQGGPCHLLGSHGKGWSWGHPAMGIPPMGLSPQPGLLGKGLQEEDHFLPGVFLFSLPNRKLAPEEAENAAL